jgi:hypothetical protein
MVGSTQMNSPSKMKEKVRCAVMLGLRTIFKKERQAAARGAAVQEEHT